jgi:hypothetical protein
MPFLKSFSRTVGNENSPMPGASTLLKLNSNEDGIIKLPRPKVVVLRKKDLLLFMVKELSR